ncbi:MAG: 4'-phosphopantetheinyl transferase superfamily protein [Pirellulales bacterium]
MTAERVGLAQLRSVVPPQEHQAHVWFCSLGDFASDRFRMLLSPIEQDQAGQFASAGARDRFLVGRGVLRRLLGAYLSIAPAEVAIAIEPSGKPRLAVKRDHHALYFNLAHSGDGVLLGITSGGEIGVDIEHHRQVSHWQAIAERHYSCRELATLRSVGVEEQRELFFRIWTRKEAVLKWLGTGLQVPLSEVDVPTACGDQAWVALPQAGQRCWAQPVDAPVGYSAALATSLRTTHLLQRQVVPG